MNLGGERGARRCVPGWTVALQVDDHDVVQVRVLGRPVGRVHAPDGLVGPVRPLGRLRGQYPLGLRGVRFLLLCGIPLYLIVHCESRSVSRPNGRGNRERGLPCLTELRNGIFFFLP